MIAGGVESMTRAPFVMAKAESAFSRSNAVYDTTIGWRFVNPLMKEQYGVDSMPETAENVARRLQDRARADQDAFALRSQQQRGRAAQAAGFFDAEIVAGDDRAEEGRSDRRRRKDEHPRETSARGAGQAQGRRAARTARVTAGNASRRQRRRLRAAARRRSSAASATA